MQCKVGLLACVFVMAGCATTAVDTPWGNNNNPPGTCSTAADCSASQVCCEAPGSPVIDGEVLTVCSAPGGCCNCFAQGSCDRCEPGVEECFLVAQGQGECQAVPCQYPTCSSSEDCPSDEICCTDLTSTCESCLGACLSPTADECTTVGWECGGGPYASAQPPNAPWGVWMRRHRIIPLPVDSQGVATISATFRWQHDAGRPPPHDFAIGLGESRAPVFQVFGRDGRVFARFGLRLVALEKQEVYRISLTLQPDGEATRALAELIRLRDQQAVLSTTMRLDSAVRTLWREQLSPAGRPVGSRLDLREFWIQAGGRSGQSVAQFSPPATSDVCGTSI